MTKICKTQKISELSFRNSQPSSGEDFVRLPDWWGASCKSDFLNLDRIVQSMFSHCPTFVNKLVHPHSYHLDMPLRIFLYSSMFWFVQKGRKKKKTDKTLHPPLQLPGTISHFFPSRQNRYCPLLFQEISLSCQVNHWQLAMEPMTLNNQTWALFLCFFQKTFNVSKLSLGTFKDFRKYFLSLLPCKIRSEKI